MYKKKGKPMTKILLIAGAKGSGKDYTAQLIKEELNSLGYSVAIDHFARPMKEILSTTLGVSIDTFNKMKNNKTMLWTKDEFGNFSELVDCRTVIQKFGSEAMKPIFGDCVWSKLFWETPSPEVDFMLVPDFRFPIEYKDLDHVKILKVESNKGKPDNHDSETSLNDFEFDFTVNNDDYTLDKTTVKDFLNKYLQKPSNTLTSEQWMKNLKYSYLRLMDPDGWNRANFDYSFKEEKVSEDEFIRRLNTSTVITEKNCIYYYGCDLANLKQAPYTDALLYKLIKANDLKTVLVLEHNMDDAVRISDVNDSVKFNRRLLVEIGYSEPDITKLLKADKQRLRNLYE
jgi:hypothetical protein